jgi:uncharacterized protein (TIGR02246 family)
MKRTIAGMAVLSAAILLVYWLPVGARPAPPHSPADEDAIRKMLAGYAAAYNKGDADAASQFFTADSEFTGEDGKVVKGREAICKELDQLFKTARDVKIDLTLASCRSLAADACSVSATSAISRTPGFTTTNKYALVVAKRDGAWQIADARELSGGSPAKATPLDDLSWMIGEWSESSDRVAVSVVCDWMANKHFLVRSFTVTTDGQIDLQGTEIIGYDATANQLRSWVFDSDGSFLESTWTHQGKIWNANTKGVLDNGKRASAVHTYTQIDDNSYTFASTNRDVGGQLQPNIPEIRMVRRTAGQ